MQIHEKMRTRTETHNDARNRNLNVNKCQRIQNAWITHLFAKLCQVKCENGDAVSTCKPRQPRAQWGGRNINGNYPDARAFRFKKRRIFIAGASGHSKSSVCCDSTRTAQCVFGERRPVASRYQKGRERSETRKRGASISR